MSVPSNKRRFYPVIYCVDPYERDGINHALCNVKTAQENGANGVFLIGEGLSHIALAYIYQKIRKEFPNFWIGVNFLDIDAKAEIGPSKLEGIFSSLEEADGLWINQLPHRALKLPFYSSFLFGGVAFKHGNPNPDKETLVRECEKAAQFVDVAITSGSKIGEPPSLEKLETIYKHLDKSIPLAVAGGVNEANVTSMLKYVTYFFVSESITDKYGDEDIKYLNGERVKELANIIHGVIISNE